MANNVLGDLISPQYSLPLPLSLPYTNITYLQDSPPHKSPPSSRNKSTLIIVVTPTYKRPARIADMVVLSNTLAHIKDLHWLVIEDTTIKSKLVHKLLVRSGITFNYLTVKTPRGYPKKGWFQRDKAIQYIAKNHQTLTHNYKHAVIYFADDDNAYDLRLFNDYIRNVRRFGVWAGSFLDKSIFESPVVNDEHKLIGFTSGRKNKIRDFSIDMGMFAFSVHEAIKHPRFTIGKSCNRLNIAPEPCLIRKLGFKLEEAEVFDTIQEILFFHVQTKKPLLSKTKPNRGYSTEYSY